VFRLSMPDLFDALLLAPLVADTASLAPGIGLQNFRLARADIRGALTRGMLDVAAEVALPDSTGLHRAPLLSEPHVCALRPGHPALAEPLTLGGYLDLDHIHVSGRKRGSGVVDLALRSLGVQRSIRIRLQHYLSVGELVLGSDLAVSLPRSWARTLGLIAQPLPFEVPKMETFLYRHTRSDGDAAVCWLFDRILARPPTGHSRKDQ
jgi:DNA-binding transcriptional LysR family regulator